MQQQILRSLERGAPPEADQMLVDHSLLACGEPGDVERERRKLAVEFEQLAARKDAQRQRRQRLNRMLHLVHESALQADHIARQRVIENLPATVIEHLVAEGPAVQHGVEIFTARTFAQKARPRIDPQLVNLEGLDECKFVGGELAQARPLAQRTLLAGRTGAVWLAVAYNHSCPHT